MAQRLFPNVPTAVTHARRYVSDLLHDVDPDTADAAAVMVSELATNSLRHAASHFIVCVDRSADEIEISVEDSGPGAPVPQAPNPGDASGRGLQIVAALSSRWGVTPRLDGPGKKVWFTIATPGRSAKPPRDGANTSTARRRPTSSDSSARSSDRGPRFQAMRRAAA
jgi:two-component sensor histidine kinase